MIRKASARTRMQTKNRDKLICVHRKARVRFVCVCYHIRHQFTVFSFVYWRSEARVATKTELFGADTHEHQAHLICSRTTHYA